MPGITARKCTRTKTGVSKRVRNREGASAPIARRYWPKAPGTIGVGTARRIHEATACCMRGFQPGLVATAFFVGISPSPGASETTIPPAQDVVPDLAGNSGTALQTDSSSVVLPGSPKHPFGEQHPDKSVSSHTEPTDGNSPLENQHFNSRGTKARCLR
jgi:hypothetical protein